MEQKALLNIKKVIIFLVLTFLIALSIMLITVYIMFPGSSIYVPPSVLHVLFGLGLDVNSADNMGFTALHLSSMLAQREHIKTLLVCGANIEAKNNQGWTPLHTCTINWHGGYKSISVLIKNGANIDARTNEGKTPLLLAVEFGAPPEIIEYLIAKGSNVDAIDNFGNTALHLAAENQCYFLIEVLIKSGINMFAENDDGVTALEIAMMWKDKRTLIEIVKRLNINAKTSDGSTPLHIAAYRGDLELAKLFVEKGADLSAKDNSGQTPLEIARRYNPDDNPIIDYLENLYQSQKQEEHINAVK